MTTRPVSALSDVLKHAEHGSVEEFVSALTLARLDLKSAMYCGLAYDFRAAKQYLRVLVLNQRRDILDWLLGNGEFVSSVARDVLGFGYEQQSVSFLLWLHKRVNSYFRADVFIDSVDEYFNKTMKHGLVEIASYLMNTFPRAVKQFPVSEIHPNAAEFWRNECWPFFLQAFFENRINPLIRLIAYEDVSHAIYALTHGFLARGMELPAEQKAAYINFETGVAGMAEFRSDFRTWLSWCVDSINTAIKCGRWSCAKLIIAALQETLPDHFPHDRIHYFHVENLERMDEKDMSEMIEWSVHCLNTLLLSQYPALASSAPAEASAVTTQQGIIGKRHDARRVIASAFVSAIDCDIQSARQALLENEQLAHIIKAQLGSFDCYYGIVGGDVLKSSTIETLVEYGAHPKDLRNVTNIMHVWGKDPAWIERFILGPSSLACERTGNMVEEAAKEFRSRLRSPYWCLPYVSMSDEEKFEALLWLSRTSYTSHWQTCEGYVHEVLRHPLVTIKNVMAFFPNESETKTQYCITALGSIAGFRTKTSMRPFGDAEALINALLEPVPLEEDIFDLIPYLQFCVFVVPNTRVYPDDSRPSHFSTVKEALTDLLAQDTPSPSIGLVLVVKAHVKRLEAQRKALENDGSAQTTSHRHQQQIQKMQQEDSVEQQSLHRCGASSANKSFSVPAREADNLCKIIERYCILGFMLATDQHVLDFGLAQWFFDKSRCSVAPELLVRFCSGLVTHILKGCGSNRMLFHHLRTCLGVAHTPQLYLDIMADQPLVPMSEKEEPYSSNDYIKARKELVDEVEQAMRSIAAAIIGMHHELGCGIMADAYKEALAYTHKCLFAYVNFSDEEARPTYDVHALLLQVPAIDIAAVLMIEALDDAVNNSRNTSAPPS